LAVDWLCLSHLYGTFIVVAVIQFKLIYYTMIYEMNH
jgi:hypothetical protein